MKEVVILFSLSLIILGILIILKPVIIGYLVGAFFIYLGIISIIVGLKISHFLDVLKNKK